MKLTEINGLSLDCSQLTHYKKSILNKILPRRFTLEKKKTPDYKVKWGRDSNDFGFIHIEDGFIRSKGLGAHLNLPVSWVFDKRGIYYDPSSESDLEIILEKISLSKNKEERINSIIGSIIDMNITKYNLEYEDVPQAIPDNSVVVIGQVEDDRSVLLGGTLAQKNIELIKEAKKLYPDKKLYFKPHPDYEELLRPEDSSNTKIHNICDKVLTKCSIDFCFKNFDEFIVNTSLTGFEALIRGKKVTCFGEPFYAGWGLTNDLSHKYIKRRKRTLSINELAYGVLVDYPTYFDLETGNEIRVEDAINKIINHEEQSKFTKKIISLFKRIIRKN